MNKKHLALVFGVSLALRVLFYLSSQTPLSDAISKFDCRDYFQEGKNLAFHYVLSQAKEPPFVRSAFRTPVYPLFIALALRVTRSEEAALKLVIMWQLVLGALTASLCAIALHMMIRDSRWAVAGGLAVGLEPFGIRYSLAAWSETLFVVLLILAVVLLLRHLEHGKPMNPFLLGSAICFGIATLCRPVGQHIGLVAVPLSLLLDCRFSFKKRFLKIVLPFLVAFSLVVSPWLVRNYVALNLFSLSTIPDLTKFMAAAKVKAALAEDSVMPNPRRMNEEEGKLVATFLPEFNQRYGVNISPYLEPSATLNEIPEPLTGAWCRFMSEKSKPIILQNLGLYAKGSVAMGLHMMFGFNKDALCDILNLPSSPVRVSSAMRSLCTGEFRRAFDQLVQIKLVEWVGLAWSASYALLIPALAALGVWCFLRQGNYAVGALLFLSAALLITLTAFAVSFSYQSFRYVVPAKPFLIIMATCGFQCMADISRRFRRGISTQKDAETNSIPA